MGMPGRLAVVLAFGLAAGASAQLSPYGRAGVVPAGVSEPAVVDLTPPELADPPEPHPHAEEAVGGWYAAIEFLVLTPRVRSLDFALVDPRDDLVPTGTVQSLNYRPSFGVRVAVAHRLDEGWDVGLAYMYYAAEDEFAVALPPGAILYPTLTRAGLTNEALSAASRARLTINQYDLTAGQTWANDSYRARAYAGLRFATIRHHQVAGYFGRDADCAFVNTRADYDGVGPLVGCEGSVCAGGGVGLFGRASGGILTGIQWSKFRETNNGGATVYADLRDRYTLTVPFVSLGFGVAYEYRGVFMRAGYEVSHWFGLFERPLFVDDLAEGKFVRQTSNLSLDGFFLQFGLAF